MPGFRTNAALVLAVVASVVIMFVLVLSAGLKISSTASLPQDDGVVHWAQQFNFDNETVHVTPPDLPKAAKRDSAQQIPLSRNDEGSVAICEAFGFQVLTVASPRRLFLGSLLADDSFSALEASASEGRGVFDTVVYVESNETQAKFARKIRFSEGSENLQRLQDMWSPTRVYVDHALDLHVLPRHAGPLERENYQRQHILLRWKASGMLPADVGVIADADETFSRGALLAAKHCDIPALKTGTSQDCKAPKLTASAMVFEMTPECITKGRSWYHPDMIIGECIEYIGDEGLHERAQRDLMTNSGPEVYRRGMKRRPGYGNNAADYDPKKNRTHFPLFNAWDFRMTSGGSALTLRGNYSWASARAATGQLTGYSGFHFHNFFDDAHTVHNKYRTYGHPTKNAFEVPLEKLHPDLNLTVNCVRGRSDTGNRRERVLGGFDAIVGPMPVGFEDPKHRKARHAHVVEMLRAHSEEDEGKSEGKVESSDEAEEITRNGKIFVAAKPAKVIRTEVPITSPQGYDSATHTLTLATWRVSGVAYDPADDSPAIQQQQGEPAPGLMHKAVPVSDHGVVMGLAAYPYDVLGKLERFVGTLRFTGYEGHIILGVHPRISDRERRYLKAMNVTYYSSEAGPCVSPLSGTADSPTPNKAEVGHGSGTNFIRETCSKHYNHLVFEWARYEMALAWIKGCPECKGWMLVCDVKDTVFQRPPFEDLPNFDLPTNNNPYPSPDLMLFEEAYPPPMGLDNNNWFAWGSIRNCFGSSHEREVMAAYRNKAMLCSGSTIGTRVGLSRYLTAITRRFYEMTWLGPKCTPPNAVDQPTHEWLYYTDHGYTDLSMSIRGASGREATTVPFGRGPVQTVGRLCSMAGKANLTLATIGQMNLTVNQGGFFLNHDGRPAPVVHQHDRCWGFWAKPLKDYCTKAHAALRLKVGDAVRPASTVCTGG